MRIKLLALTFGIFLAAGTAYAGPVPGGADTDGDTVEDAFDNCLREVNASQTDTDHNGCGDACQLPGDRFPLPNGDGLTSINDILLASNQSVTTNCGCTAALVPFARCTAACAGPGCGALLASGTCSGDYENNGNVAINDTLLAANNNGKRSGPSGITTAQCNPAPGTGAVGATGNCNCCPAGAVGCSIPAGTYFPSNIFP